jgi:NAD(P)H-dependent FMN reductase
MTSILIFSGSARQGAFSKQLAAAATTLINGEGGKPTLIDLADFKVPLYNADLEAESGIPQPAVDFRRLVASHDGMAIATPEYNGFVTPLLLNMLCWASRPSPGDDFGTVFQGRPVALMASSPGRLGGVRVIPRLRDIVAELGMIAIPGFVTVPDAASAFTEQGRLVEHRKEEEVVCLVRRLMTASRRG